jgi:multidrug efflux pump subunit AcrA (membrane-fusion protein)
MNPDENTSATKKPERSHRREVLLLGGLAVLLIVGLLALGIGPRMSRNAALAQRAKQVKSSVPSVIVTKPKWVADATISLPGNIEAIKETTISARSTGYLRQLFVDIGAHVKAGQVVAVVAAPDMDQQYYQATAQTSQSRAVVAESQADVKRQNAVVAQDQADVAKQRAMMEQAQAQVVSAQAAAQQAAAAEEGAEASLVHYQQAFSQQQANLKAQQAQMQLAETTYGRYKDLVSQGFDSQQDLDQALATMKADQANVAAGQAAVQSAQADISLAEKNLAAAKAAYKAAQSNVAASVKNVQANRAALVSSQDTVKYQLESVRVSQATVNANRAGVVANQANEQRYSVMRAFQKIVAPFDGVITARMVDIGALVVADSQSGSSASASALVSNSSVTAGGGGLLGIARTDEVRIQVSVPQAFVNSLMTGSNAVVTVRELPGRTFNGSVTLRAGALDTTSRTQLVEVHIKNTDGSLVPGMYASVEISPLNPPRTLRVPGTALIVDASGTRVGIVTPKKVVHLQPVEIGRDFGTEVEILKGLEGNELLINNPSDLLQEGDKVQIVAPTGGRRGRGGAGGAAGSEGAGGQPGGAAGATGGSGRPGRPRSGAETGGSESSGGQNGARGSGAAGNDGTGGQPGGANGRGTASGQ